MADDILQVLDSFIAADGTEYHKGEVVRATNPAVKKYPASFGPIQISHEPPEVEPEPEVEQATAAPGEKRGATKDK